MESVGSFSGAGYGNRRLHACGGILIRRATHCFAIGTATALFAENSPPDCFLFAQTLPGSIPCNNKTADTNVPTVLMEQGTGIEPASEAWEASVLPMN